MRRFATALAAGVVAAIVPTATSAQDDAISVEIYDRARLLRSGAVRVRIDISCEPFGVMGENVITITQDDNAVFGQRSIGVLRCDGHRRLYRVVVTPFEGAFHEGDAFASAFVSQIDPVSGDMRQNQDVETITVK
jgi:hypothetical protein